jgi:hypothetical protein
VTHAGRELKNPVKFYGGIANSEYNPSGDPWSSGFGAVKSKWNNFREAQDMVQGNGRVIGLNAAMGPSGAYFSKPPAALAREMMRENPAGLGPDAFAAFDQEMIRGLQAEIASAAKTGGSSDAQARALRDFRGVGSGNLDEMLDQNPSFRTLFMHSLAKPGIQKLGFPDIDIIHKAQTDPRLMHTLGDVGADVANTGKMAYVPDFNRPPTRGTSSWNPSYDTEFHGEQIGGLKHPMSITEAWPELLNNKSTNYIRSAQMSKRARVVKDEDIERWEKRHRELEKAGADK